ncbi:hypothetical protein Tco_0593341 [Tanacetum coccineum]
MKIGESLNVTFDKTPPPSKISPLVDDDLDEEEAIKITEKKNLENDIEDETLETDEEYDKEQGKKGSKTMVGVDVDTLTMDQYLALSQENQATAMVKPKIGGNVNFEIKSQFMREMREDIFSWNKNEDAHDYIDRVLSIVGLFNIL